MQHIGVEALRQRADFHRRGDIGKAEQARDRQAVDAQFRALGEHRQFVLGRGVRALAVDHHADFMPARRKVLGQVDHVAEQATDRRPHDLQDAQRSGGVHDASGPD